MSSENSSADDLCVCGADRGAHKIIHSHAFTNEDPEPKGSVVSLENEGPRCPYINEQGRQCRLVEDHGPIHQFNLAEPKGSASSSLDKRDFCGQCKHHRRYHDDEMCTVCPAFTGDQRHAFVEAKAASPDEKCARCDHSRRYHSDKFGCNGCAIQMRGSDSIHAFVPANMEAGGEPEAPGEQCRCGHPRAGHSMGPCFGEVLAAMGTDRENCRCRVFVPAGPETAREPEAPHEHEWSEWGAVYHGGPYQWRECACGATVSRPEPEPEAPERECPEGGLCRSSQCARGCRRLVPEGPVSISSRPPYAVAYATGSGELVEIALPGEATCAVVNGALVISHPSTVLGIQQIKPMEGQ
jgi:hypothetical protein